MTDPAMPSPILATTERQCQGLMLFELESDFDYETLNFEVRAASTARRTLEAERLDIVRANKVALDKATKRYVEAIGKLDSAIKVADTRLIAYHSLKEQLRREAQAKLDEAARIERERLQAEAAKLAAKSDALEAKAEETGDAKLLARAESAQHQAAVLESASSLVVSQDADVGAVKAKGMAVVTRYGYEIIDLMELAKAVVAGTVPLAAFLPNDRWLGNRARNDKDEFKVPGCRLVKTKTASHRGI